MPLNSVDNPSVLLADSKPPLRERVDAVIDAALAEQRVVGTVVLAAKDGEIIYSRAAGFADREANRPMTPDTLFRLASVSKVYASVAAMALVAQGRLALDAPVTNWLPDFRPASPDGSIHTITIRHLLNHMAGLSYGFLEPTDGPYHRAGVSDGMDLADVTLAENIRRIGTVPLLFAPGTAWNYSLATDVLGLVIECAAGLPLAEAVRELVMGPLGLIDTGFAVTDPERLAAGYVDDGGAPRRMADLEIIPLPFIEGSEGLRMSLARAFDESAYPSGGAGMIGSAGDLLAVLEALRKGGAPLLSVAQVEAMIKDQTPGMDLLPWPGRGFGLGFTILRDPVAASSPEPVGTWRMGGAYGHSWFVDRTNGLTVVAFTNAGLEGQSPGGRFPDELVRAIYG
ncbi:CubicO group peptidase (beta-lactamase class C family) [Agrobacterium vitis]|nr:CubicO group peptidase (beta-lactamase class C family) [Agrobacterium vitis]MBE1440272.1 CubicO group peptidase (beta-lactamase class C family) [Agrobacterium vitis]